MGVQPAALPTVPLLSLVKGAPQCVPTLPATSHLGTLKSGQGRAQAVSLGEEALLAQCLEHRWTQGSRQQGRAEMRMEGQPHYPEAHSGISRSAGPTAIL